MIYLLPHTCQKGNPNKGQKRQATFNNGVRQLGCRMECDGTSQSTMKTTKNDGQHDSTTRLSCRNFVHLVQDYLVVCASFYHHLLNQHERTINDGKLCAIITQDWMDELHHLFLYVKECVGNLNVTEEAAPYAGVLIH
jgi:hypothetical protein